MIEKKNKLHEKLTRAQKVLYRYLSIKNGRN